LKEALRVSFILTAALCAGEPVPYEPTSNYEVQNIEGWAVHVNRAVMSSKDAVHAETLKELRCQLYEINRRVPKAALDRLHEVPIWVEAKSKVKCMCYHPSEQWLRNNHKEYFAELSEAYFGTNDMYPFVRAELMKHDPEAHALLKKLWGQ